MGKAASLCQVGSGKIADLPNRKGKFQVSMYQQNPNYSSNRDVQRRMPSAPRRNLGQYNRYDTGQKVTYNPNSYPQESSERRGNFAAQAAQRPSNVPYKDRNGPESFWRQDIRGANVAPTQDRMPESGEAEILQRRLNEVWHDLEHCRSNNNTSVVLEKLEFLQSKILELTPNQDQIAQEEQIELQAMKLRTLERKIEDLVAIANGKFQSNPGGQLVEHGDLIKRGALDVAQPKLQGDVRDTRSNIDNFRQHPSQGYLISPNEINAGMESARSRNMAVNETSVGKQFNAVSNPTGRNSRPEDKRMDVGNVPYWNGASTQTNHVNGTQNYQGRGDVYRPTYGDRQLPPRYSSEMALRETGAANQPPKLDRRQWQGAFANNNQGLPHAANANNLIDRRRPNNFVGPPMYKTQVPQPVPNLALRKTSLYRGWAR